MLNMKLRQARHYLDMTQTDLAKEFGVTKMMVSWWETGRHRPCKARRMAIKKYFEEKGILLEDI